MKFNSSNLNVKGFFSMSIVLVLVAFWLIIPVMVTATVEYTITDLGNLGYITGTWPNDINNNGQVVGRSQVSANQNRAFLWQNGTMTNLGTLGGSYSEAGSINNSGQIVGAAYNSYGTCHPFIYQNGSMTDLYPSGNDYTYGSAECINDVGQVVGPSYIGGRHPYLWQNGTFTDLQTRGMFYASTPHAINASGEIIHDSGTIGSYCLLIESTIYNIGNLGGSSSDVKNISILGQIVGSSFFAGNTVRHAYRWTPEIPFAGVGTMKDLGTLGGTNSYGMDVNAWGSVVGFSEISGGGQRAFVYKCCSMQDLNSLIDPNSGWVLTTATAINDRGQIVGVGTYGGNSLGFLLTPIP